MLNLHEHAAVPAPRSDRKSCQPHAVLLIPEAHLKLRTVVELTGLSESTIRRRVATGDFPQPVRHGKRCTRWIAGDLSAWLRSADPRYAGLRPSNTEGHE